MFYSVFQQECFIFDFPVYQFDDQHCMKKDHIRSYSHPYFPAFGLNTDQSNSEYGHVLCSASVSVLGNYICSSQIFSEIKLLLSLIVKKQVYVV